MGAALSLRSSTPSSEVQPSKKPPRSRALTKLILLSRLFTTSIFSDLQSRIKPPKSPLLEVSNTASLSKVMLLRLLQPSKKLWKVATDSVLTLPKRTLFRLAMLVKK